ncbi:MAG TPA: type II secretion system protein GspG [Tepidisphaeraceae bacterium]|nr:type II secretion system protein GspG [Tepidisphaeraceae bacterium]
MSSLSRHIGLALLAGVFACGGIALAAPKPKPIDPAAVAPGAQKSMASIAEALSAFKADVGRYPTTTEGLRSLIDKPLRNDKWKGPYLKQPLLLTDPWKRPYGYKFPGASDPKGFDLFSPGPDGRPDTGDEIKYEPAAK